MLIWRPRFVWRTINYIIKSRFLCSFWIQWNCEQILGIRFSLQSKKFLTRFFKVLVMENEIKSGFRLSGLTNLYPQIACSVVRTLNMTRFLPIPKLNFLSRVLTLTNVCPVQWNAIGIGHEAVGIPPAIALLIITDAPACACNRVLWRW